MMPVLSRGKHRNAKRGACFMEMASYLAGEKWSDHPACTHGLLAAVARDVNDYVEDGARSRIVPLIPSVVGLTTDDPRADAWIAQEVALIALPIAPAPRQRVAAVGLVRCEEVLNDLEGRPTEAMRPEIRAALDAQPHARDWAYRFLRRGRSTSARSFNRRSAPVIARASVAGVAEALGEERDERLVGLLERVVVLCEERFPQAAMASSVVSAASPAERQRTRA
ncbi:hypothetical protein D9V37_15105 [Nocardioides mangrovicus]|uniref:Uncharacterized protein n=2 Tax=Nocardioides mangrovicus TaxID=2478913 RepID=A0A3L8NWI4_9ACTN|nr:hypothetical protein D9V37_15105 [Nocardioides mangrovicus]